MKAMILAIFMVCPTLSWGQETKLIDFENILSFTRAGVFHADEGQKWAMAYVPVISMFGISSKAEYVNLNVGITSEMNTGEKQFLTLIGFRIDTFLAKVARLPFAEKILSFATIPSLEIAPGIMTSDFKRYVWGIGLAYKFSK